MHSVIIVHLLFLCAEQQGEDVMNRETIEGALGDWRASHCCDSN